MPQGDVLVGLISRLLETGILVGLLSYLLLKREKNEDETKAKTALQLEQISLKLADLDSKDKLKEKDLSFAQMMAQTVDSLLQRVNKIGNDQNIFYERQRQLEEKLKDIKTDIDKLTGFVHKR